MKKPIIFAVIGFVVALAASTFLGMQKLKKANAATALAAAAHADSLAALHPADSSAGHDSTAKEGGEHGAPVADAPKPAADGHGEATPAAHGEQPTAEPAGPKIVPVSAVDPAEKADAYKQVARVLSAMKATEAVKVMAFLSDEEVEGILRAVGPRQAGDFLTNLPKERAATLSRRLLVPKPKVTGQ